MAMSNAERQKKFRDKQPLSRKVGGAHRKRLSGYIDSLTRSKLRSLAAYYGVSQQAVIEMLIESADKRIMEQLRKNPDESLEMAYIQARLRQDGSLLK